ncbi:uncharacterized protein LAJ45_03807 [Morchella importuna]|uniref:lytic cellulose monooxygenase (C4-dehydrogenating) n=1 Tax=Morchella conica CCBAS932 TaxID=1392247 RepID=A0A3N4KEQ4_9PEZI|nr:uncharacterized protein LAJ45_03807 [Morchella importuna]KAH8151816.1 hypothetical protein LAJ45_03807 [Morchella importuna]RPB07958.1 glycoside hydrolase [Morchella conica CCBAS932]
MKVAIVSLLAFTAGLVSGHGYVSQATIDNVVYSGYLPYSDPYYSTPPSRIFRKINGNGPVEDVTLIDLQCGGYTAGGIVGSAPAALTAPVTPGSTVSLLWTQWPDSHKGPVITYMAKCPSSCTDYMPGTAAVWFKVAETGKSGTTWGSTPLETNVPYTFKIPSTLKPGNYIVRHEIIALHSAYSYPGAQFYPSCFQVTVSGSGTGFPTSFVSIPGVYTASTPGVVYDIYTTGTASYPIPGPAVWTG